MNLWRRGQKPAKYGLVNQGATCYLNSVLQVLFMTEDFKERVKSYKRLNTRTEHIDNELTDLFSDLEKNTAYTYKITKKLKIKNVHEQRDAAEHYEKILRLTSPEASEIFHGELINRTKCQKCNTQTESEAGFWHLPLPLVDSDKDYSVEKGIEDFFRPSVISGENQMYCEKCDEKRDAVLDCVVKHHPEVLVLLLKRFEFDYRYMTYIKINRAVNVPHTLLIPQNQSYELYAVVEHFGELRCGHYYSTIKSQSDGDWYIFDDSNISPLNALPKMERSKSAYLLFYRKQKDPIPVVNETSDTVPIEITIKTEDTTATSGEEEDKSVRAAPKRAMSLNESESAENAQVKKQKQLCDQAVEPLQAATGEGYENITEKNTEGVSDKDRQDLDFFQETHEPDVKMHDSKQQRVNNDWNQPRQSPSEAHDSLVDIQFNGCNSSPMTTKGASEHVTRGEKVQSVSQQPSGQEYDSHKLENESDTGAHKLTENISRSDSGTQVCKDCVGGDRSWNNGQSPDLSRAPVNSEFVDMKHVPGGEHVNIGEGDQAGMRGSLEISALQSELSSDQNCICVRNQDKNSCVEENQSDIGAHALNSGRGHRNDYEPVVKSGCKDDVGMDTLCPGLSGVPMKRNESKQCLRARETEKEDVLGGEHVNIGEGNQAGVRGSLEKTLQPKYCADKDKQVVQCQKSCSQKHQSDTGALQSDEGQRSSYDSVRNDIISEDGCANIFGDCMLGSALTSVPMNASRQSSMAKDTDVTSECDNIEEGIQGKEKQDDWSHIGTETLDGLSCCCKNGCECKGDVAEDTPYSNLDHSGNSCPSLSGVPITRNDSKDFLTPTEVDENELAGELAAEDQAGLRGLSVGSENTAHQPTSDQYKEQQGNIYKTQRPEDQSDIGELAEIKIRGSHEIIKNVADVTSETTPDLGCVTVNRNDSEQLKEIHRDIEQTKEKEQVNERGKSSFVGVSVQGTGKTESEEDAHVKSLENYDLCVAAKDNIKDQDVVVHDRKATVQKRLLTKYDLYLDSVNQYKEICQQNVSKSAQMSNKSQSEKLDRTDEVKDSQNSATKSRECYHCTSDNSFEENKESPEQRKSESASRTDKESEQKERPDQLQGHKTKYSKSVTNEGDTEIIRIIPEKNQGYTQPNVRHEKSTVSNNPISSHDNKVHEADSLSEGVDRSKLNHLCEVMTDKTVDQCSNTEPQT